VTLDQGLDRAAQLLDQVAADLIDANAFRMIEAGVDEATVVAAFVDAWQAYGRWRLEALVDVRTMLARACICAG
jgi:hypothetical protein